MCGIAGIIGAYEENQLDAMLSSQHHRGPDFTGKYLDSNFAVVDNSKNVDFSLGSSAKLHENIYVKSLSLNNHFGGRAKIGLFFSSN